MEKAFNKGDKVRLLHLDNAGPEHSLKVGGIYTVKSGGTTISLEEDKPRGLWYADRFELIELDAEFYVVEVRLNSSNQETFVRSNGLYKKRYGNIVDAEQEMVKQAETNIGTQYAVMQITSRAKTEPLYITNVVRSA
jgi:hypothetical protein